MLGRSRFSGSIWIEPFQSCLRHEVKMMREPGSETSGLLSVVPRDHAGGSARATQNLAELRSADSRRRLSPHNLMLTSDAYFPTQWSTQSFTVLYQSWEFWGFRTQWPSSGKYNIFEGMPSICRVVKSWKPSLTSKR